MEDGAMGQQPLHATMDEAVSRRHLNVTMETQEAMVAICAGSLGILLITVHSNPSRVRID
jgi:hypothetical protein